MNHWKIQINHSTGSYRTVAMADSMSGAILKARATFSNDLDDGEASATKFTQTELSDINGTIVNWCNG